MNILTYDVMELTTIRKTALPAEVVGLGLQTCMKKSAFMECATEAQLQFLLSADHQSPLEHAGMTIYIKNVSRAFLAQFTRHRTFKFTVSSQHYQTYNDYEFIVSQKTLDLAEKYPKYHTGMLKSFRNDLNMYDESIERGLPKEEARQYLPNAMACNILVTMDCRNLVNFFRQRLCMRNVEEMITFSRKLWTICVAWFPELFENVGPPCHMVGKCTQGAMKAQPCKDAGNFKMSTLKEEI